MGSARDNKGQKNSLDVGQPIEVGLTKANIMNAYGPDFHVLETYNFNSSWHFSFFFLISIVSKITIISKRIK